MHAHTRVVIIGGGIAGLAAALALVRRGFQVRVLEKDPSFAHRKQGYGLTLQQGGLALNCLGLGQAIAGAPPLLSAAPLSDFPRACLPSTHPNPEPRTPKPETRNPEQPRLAGRSLTSSLTRRLLHPETPNLTPNPKPLNH